ASIMLGEAGGAGAARASPAVPRRERARDPDLHPATNGLMTLFSRWRASHYVAAGVLSAGGLVWATREAWPWRRPLTAPPIVVSEAYAEVTETLGRREVLSDVLGRAGITGRDYVALLAAARHLTARRLRTGLASQVRRLKTDSQAGR